MADTRIIYPVDNYLGAVLAEAVGKFNEARNKLHQIQDMVGAIGDDPDVETAMGMAHDLYYAYSMKEIIAGALTAMDNAAPGMTRLDKGL